jgi:hypothetical protein
MRNISKADWFSSKEDLFIGCASFERERASAGLEAVTGLFKCVLIVRFEGKIRRGLVFEKTRSVSELHSLACQRDVTGLAGLITTDRLDIHHLLSGIAAELKLRHLLGRALNITVDISCFTRVQLVS